MCFAFILKSLVNNSAPIFFVGGLKGVVRIRYQKSLLPLSPINLNLTFPSTLRLIPTYSLFHFIPLCLEPYDLNRPLSSLGLAFSTRFFTSAYTDTHVFLLGFLYWSCYSLYLSGLSLDCQKKKKK